MQLVDCCKRANSLLWGRIEVTLQARVHEFEIEVHTTTVL